MKSVTLNDFVLIKPDEIEESKTEGGIIIPKTANKPSNRGTIISVSKAIEYPPVTIGDVVLFSSYSKDSVILDGIEYLIMPIKDLKMKILE